MTFTYITGIAGAGKSEVYKKLKARGLKVYGTDEDQLAGFYDNFSGDRLQNPPEKAEDRTTEWRERYTWKLPRATIEKLKSEASDIDIYLCGVAANEEEFLDLFDALIALEIDDKTLQDRIFNRTTNTFGKSSHEVDMIMEWQRQTKDYYEKYHYKIINATQPVEKVVEEVLNS